MSNIEKCIQCIPMQITILKFDINQFSVDTLKKYYINKKKYRIIQTWEGEGGLLVLDKIKQNFLCRYVRVRRVYFNKNFI